ncbi:malate dehydrogenase domain protein [Mycobacterium intracellulare 1956]|uniref:Malate dehydrogenase domain protein n=1 Tax=Mycobacterium intracellulare 1956 TaxID=1299331 RepID=X8CNQ5_MYCIT|nr:malate dehydrogenase domain protein [Mycobacterium intracellulare 1956]
MRSKKGALVSSRNRNPHDLLHKEYIDVSASPLKVAVTGAAGQIGYSLLFRLASGSLLGPTARSSCVSWRSSPRSRRSRAS